MRLVEESLNLAWHGARAETQGFEIKLKQSFDPSTGGADVFPQDIRRALLNLIANGFHATKRKAEANHGDYEPTLTASTKSLIILLKQLTFAPGRGTVAGRTALEGKTVHITDLAADPAYTGPTITFDCPRSFRQPAFASSATTSRNEG
jgi:hypothetical protein